MDVYVDQKNERVYGRQAEKGWRTCIIKGKMAKFVFLGKSKLSCGTFGETKNRPYYYIVVRLVNRAVWRIGE